MNEQTAYREQIGKTMELSVGGCQVTLSFPREPDLTVSKRVRESLIDSFIQKYGIKDREN